MEVPACAAPPPFKMPISLIEIEKMTDNEVAKFRLSGSSSKKVKRLTNEKGLSYIVAKRQVITDNFINWSSQVINREKKKLEAILAMNSSERITTIVSKDGEVKTKMELERIVAYQDPTLKRDERPRVDNPALLGNYSNFIPEQPAVKKMKLESKEEFSFAGKPLQKIALANDGDLNFHSQSGRSGAIEFSLLDKDERIFRNDNQVPLGIDTTYKPDQSLAVKIRPEANYAFTSDTAAVVPNGYPRIQLDSERLLAVQYAILGEYDKLTRGGPQIRLGKCTHHSGFLLIYCCDTVTIDWLRTIVPQLKPWEGAALKVLVGNDIPRPLVCTVFVPNENNRKLECDKILHRLQLGNQRLNTKLWAIQGSSPAENGQLWTFIIDKGSLDELKLLGMCPYFGFGRLKFRIEETGVKKDISGTLKTRPAPNIYKSIQMPSESGEIIKQQDCGTWRRSSWQEAAPVPQVGPKTFEGFSIKPKFS